MRRPFRGEYQRDLTATLFQGVFYNVTTAVASPTLYVKHRQRSSKDNTLALAANLIVSSSHQSVIFGPKSLTIMNKQISTACTDRGPTEHHAHFFNVLVFELETFSAAC